MVIDDFHVDRFTVFPDETDAELVIYPDGVLASASTT